MKRLKLNLETSAFNFAFAEDAPKESEVTLKLERLWKPGFHSTRIWSWHNLYNKVADKTS